MQAIHSCAQCMAMESERQRVTAERGLRALWIPLPHFADVEKQQAHWWQSRETVPPGSFLIFFFILSPANYLSHSQKCISPDILNSFDFLTKVEIQETKFFKLFYCTKIHVRPVEKPNGSTRIVTNNIYIYVICSTLSTCNCDAPEAPHSFLWAVLCYIYFLLHF